MLAAGSTCTVRSSPGACIVAVFFSNRDTNFTLHWTHRCMGRQCWCRRTELAIFALCYEHCRPCTSPHLAAESCKISRQPRLLEDTTLWSLTVAGCMLFVTGGNDSVLFRAFTRASNVTVFMAAALCLCFVLF